jgi:hypothetical protein
VLVACRNKLDMGGNSAKILALYRLPGPPHPRARVGHQSIAPDGFSDGNWNEGVWSVRRLRP